MVVTFDNSLISEGLYLAVVSILDFDGFKCISILIRFAICRCYACLPNFMVPPVGVDEIKFIKGEDECFGVLTEIKLKDI